VRLSSFFAVIKPLYEKHASILYLLILSSGGRVIYRAQTRGMFRSAVKLQLEIRLFSLPFPLTSSSLSTIPTSPRHVRILSAAAVAAVFFFIFLLYSNGE
jgi:hypothetical protein